MADALTLRHPRCPRCDADLSTGMATALDLHRCGTCAGVWLDAAMFRAAIEAAARTPGATTNPDIHRPEPPVRYLRCPACAEVMDRVNFARVSGVIVDVCRAHGVWLDAGELDAIRRFVRGPGLADAARSRALAAERERVRMRDSALGTGGNGPSIGADAVELLDCLLAVVTFL
jgi:Zn-finger nucleic acid-binding protein